MATQIQAAVSSALQEVFKLQDVQPETNPPVIGGPQTLRITHETAHAVKHLEGKTVTIDGDGTVTVND
jgi:hypothetical protein